MFQHRGKTGKQAPPQPERANVYEEQQAVCLHSEPAWCQPQAMSVVLDPDGIAASIALEAQPLMNNAGNQNSALAQPTPLSRVIIRNLSFLPNITLVLQNTSIVSNEHRLIKNECDKDISLPNPRNKLSEAQGFFQTYHYILTGIQRHHLLQTLSQLIFHKGYSAVCTIFV